jgi:hypothetical protein
MQAKWLRSTYYLYNTYIKHEFNNHAEFHVQSEPDICAYVNACILIYIYYIDIGFDKEFDILHI